MTTFKNQPITPEVAAELEKVVRLEHENTVLLQKLIMEIHGHGQEKLNVACLKRIISNRPSYKHLFWRLWWK
jgi:hypothetical protein